jgi:hypothetical protein
MRAVKRKSPYTPVNIRSAKPIVKKRSARVMIRSLDARRPRYPMMRLEEEKAMIGIESKTDI